MNKDKHEAYGTLYYVLVSLTKVLAPSIPFVTDKIFCNLTNHESVHLAWWPEIPTEFNDPDLVDRVSFTRRIAALGLALRQQQKVKVRQPLQRLLVAVPAMNESLPDSHVELLRNELNVKEICFLENPEEVALLRAVPNAGKLGPVYGRDMQEIIQAARQGNVKPNGAAGTVVVFNEHKEWILDADDIEIGYQGKEGVDVMSESGILVGLDMTMTPELLAEGVVNDLNRCIQNLRKEAGYSVSDRILLDIQGDLADGDKAKLAASALAERVALDEETADAHCETTINGLGFRLLVKRK